MNHKTIIIVCGTLCAGVAASARADLVSNGGFEANNGTTSFTGWTNTGNGITVDALFPASGSYDAAFGATSTDPSPGVLSQPLATIAGTPYVLTFSLLDEAGLPIDFFTVTFGGFSAVLTGDTAGSYTSESFVVPGAAITGASTTLSFQGTNEVADWNLDDVSVVSAIPEPSAGVLFAASVLALPALLWGRFARGPKVGATFAG